MYEDATLLAVNKPCGIASTPAAGQASSVLSLVEKHVRARGGADKATTLFPLHRLDVPTSGVLLFAKTPRACAPVSRAFTKGSVRKQYWALLSGALPEESSDTKWVDMLEPGSNGRMRVSPSSEAVAPSPAARRAETRFSVLERFGASASAVQLSPVTGRTHQLRVQAAARGISVIGDALYGTQSGARTAGAHLKPPRLCLHCASLSLEHPMEKGKMLVLEAPLPEELKAFVEKLRARGETQGARGGG